MGAKRRPLLNESVTGIPAANKTDSWRKDSVQRMSIESATRLAQILADEDAAAEAIAQLPSSGSSNVPNSGTPDTEGGSAYEYVRHGRSRGLSWGAKPSMDEKGRERVRFAGEGKEIIVEDRVEHRTEEAEQNDVAQGMVEEEDEEAECPEEWDEMT
jgi:hypothetical protein